MSTLVDFVRAYPRELAGLAVLVGLSLTRPGRWTWRHWWWPLACWAGRQMLPEKDRYTVAGKKDRRRWFTDAEKAAALRRSDRCQCPGGNRADGGCGSVTHAYSGQCEVIHLHGQKLVGGHRIAHAQGGRTNAANLVMLCHDCNTAYSDRPVPHLPPRRRWWPARHRAPQVINPPTWFPDEDPAVTANRRMHHPDHFG